MRIISHREIKAARRRVFYINSRAPISSYVASREYKFYNSAITKINSPFYSVNSSRQVSGKLENSIYTMCAVWRASASIRAAM